MLRAAPEGQIAVLDDPHRPKLPLQKMLNQNSFVDVPTLLGIVLGLEAQNQTNRYKLASNRSNISIRQFQDWEKRVDQNSQQQDPTKQRRPCKPRSGSFQWAWKPAGPVESDVELQRSWKRKAHT
jgi:hypothetical protein